MSSAGTEREPKIQDPEISPRRPEPGLPPAPARDPDAPQPPRREPPPEPPEPGEPVPTIEDPDAPGAAPEPLRLQDDRARSSASA